MTYPLHYASKMGHLGTVTNLLRQGMGVNTRDRNGFTPLMKAVTYRRSNVVNRLIQAGANVNARRPDGAASPVIFYALMWSTDEILKKLINANVRLNRNSISPDMVYYAGFAVNPSQRRILLNAKERLNRLNNFRGRNSLVNALRKRQTGNRFHPYRRG